MARTEQAMALRTGFAAAVTVVALEVLYLVVLVIGLWRLPAPDLPIQDPWFTAMEGLILALVPAMILLNAMLCAIAPRGREAFALAALAFMSVMAGLTASVHFSILFLSRDPSFAGMEHLLAFRWPSLVYVLDILAWDVFFPFGALFTALALPGDAAHRRTRRLFLLSAALAALGLLGVFLGDMRWRNLGILGYVGVFPVAVALLAQRFRESPRLG